MENIGELRMVDEKELVDSSVPRKTCSWYLHFDGR